MFKPPTRKMILGCHIQKSWARTFFICAINCHKNNHFLLENRTSCTFCVKPRVKRPYRERYGYNVVVAFEKKCMAEFLKKNRTHMLTIKSGGSMYTNFVTCKISYEQHKPKCDNRIPRH